MREEHFGLPFRDTSCPGDLAAQIDAAYDEAHRRSVLSYLDSRDVHRGFTQEGALRGLIVVACLFGAVVLIAVLA